MMQDKMDYIILFMIAAHMLWGETMDQKKMNGSDEIYSEKRKELNREKFYRIHTKFSTYVDHSKFQIVMKTIHFCKSCAYLLRDTVYTSHHFERARSSFSPILCSCSV